MDPLRRRKYTQVHAIFFLSIALVLS
jgi:hypothetical protein